MLQRKLYRFQCEQRPIWVFLRDQQRWIEQALVVERLPKVGDVWRKRYAALALHNGLPPHVLLVLDAAYAEYVRRNDYEAGLELVATSENVVMTRTFSKIHGLAALRLGWMVGPAHIVDAINRIRGPFNVNSAAIALYPLLRHLGFAETYSSWSFLPAPSALP